MLLESDARSDLLAHVARRGGAKIVRRQTTHWDVEVSSATGLTTYRIHFHRKRESRFEGASFRTFAITDSHPVLADYAEIWASVFISTPTQIDPAQALAALDREICALSDGWRDLNSYSNSSASVVDVLSDGHGLVLNGPSTIAALAAEILNRVGARASVLSGVRQPALMQALILDRSFEVAERFRVDLESSTAQSTGAPG